MKKAIKANLSPISMNLTELLHPICWEKNISRESIKWTQASFKL